MDSNSQDLAHAVYLLSVYELLVDTQRIMAANWERLHEEVCGLPEDAQAFYREHRDALSQESATG